MKQRYRSLNDYFEANPDKSQGELAEALGISGAYVSMLRSGERQPGRKLALRIEQLIGVPVASWPDTDAVAS